MSKSIAVFGLGRFGKSLALSLYETGAQVMVVDKNESIIENISDKVTYAVIADLTNPDDINKRSGRRLSIFNANTLGSIEFDAKSSVKADSATTMSEILDLVSKE